MNIEIQFLIGAGCLSAAALILSLATLLRNRTQQRQLVLDSERIDLLEDTLAESRDLFELSQKTVADHSRRIAWLDAAVRRNRFVTVSEHKPQKGAAQKKSNIDEKRNRVLTLAERGQDPGTIAATLGMMPGEVELMLNLNNHVAALA